jgi:hypothetical protein
MTGGRWTDDRLDDALGHIDRRLQSVEGVNLRLASLETEMGFMRADVQECGASVKSLHATIDERREEERKERRSDRRWYIGTGLTSAGLVIGALALLVDKL